MYICLDCGRVFNNPRNYTESYGESWEGCPNCAGAFVTAVRCQECDRWIPMDEDDDLCDDCKKDVVVRLGKLIDDNFSRNCKDWIYNWVEETPLQDCASWKRLARPDST